MKIQSTNMTGAIKYRLRESMTTEELYSLMRERWAAELPGDFKLKKGFLFGPYICFDTYLTIQPHVKVKNDTLSITRATVETRVGGIDINATKQAINAIKDGGNIMNVALGGQEYFLKVCAEIEVILKDKIISK